MKKVLLVTPELEYTGALQSYRRMCKVLINNDYKVTAVSHKDGPFASEIHKIGIDVEVLDFQKLKGKKIKKYIKKFDLVIANTIETYKVADIAQNYVPTIWYVREADNLPEFFGKDYRRREAFERAKNIYVVSEYAQEYIINNFNENIRVLHNCVEDDSKNTKVMERDKSVVKFLALGTIEERKGYDIFLHAYMQLPEELRNKCELHFAGRLVDWAKWFYEPLLEEIADYSNIFYHGEVNDRNKINQLIEECDCVVVVSRDESCSLVVLEAAMQSKPIIISENIGAKYIVTPECGWCVKTGSVEALKNVYEQILTLNIDLQQMGKKARERYLETSTYEIYERNFLKVVKENIENPCQGNGRTTVKEFLEIECEKKLVSFDVFDTLITRNTLNPRGIFALMQTEIQSDNEFDSYTKANFYTLRIRAEEEARKKCGFNKCEDITLDEIYQYMAVLGVGDSYINSLKEMEIKKEKDNIVPIYENIHLVEEYIKSGTDTVLISDMYLSKQQIRELLIPYSEIFKNIEIYVSSDYKKTKSTGNLFRIVRRDKNIAFHEWLHYGDHIKNDIQTPQSLGIHTKFYDFPVLDKYIKNICKNYDFHNQVLFGIARNILITNKNSMMYKVGVTVGGTILFPYARWILKWAMENKINTLYFVARDGYLVKKIVDLMIEQQKLGIKTKYLYGSRKAWRLPALTNEEMDVNEYIKASNWNFISTIDSLADTFGVTAEEIIRYSFIAKENRMKKIGKEILFKIIDDLNCDDFKDMLAKKNHEVRENVLKYLIQEINFNEKYAFVEMSGTGYTQNCLQMLINAIMPNSQITTLFFNLRDCKQFRNCFNVCFIPNNVELIYMVELFSRSLENQTVGYHQINGKMESIFDGDDKCKLEDYGYGEYIDGVLEYAQEASKIFAKMPYISPNISSICDYIKGIFNGSYSEVLPFLSNMPYDNTGRQRNTKIFAPKPTDKEVLDIHFLHFAENAQLYYSGAEYAIGQKLLDDKQKKAISYYKKYRQKPIGHAVRGILLIKQHGLRYSTKYIYNKLFKQ